MQFDFHTSVGRGPENLKQRYTPPCIVQKGYASFAGAGAGDAYPAGMDCSHVRNDLFCGVADTANMWAQRSDHHLDACLLSL